MSNPVIGVDVVASLDGFRRELAKIPDIGADEARALAAKMNKEIQALTRAQKKATDTARQHKDATKGLGDAAGKAGQSSAKLAGILSTLAPGLGEVARLGNDLADAAEVGAEGMGSLGASAGVVGIALAALGAAYVALQGDIERANAVMQTSAEVASNVESLSRSLESARVDLAVATGALTEAEGRQEKANLAVLDTVDRLAQSQAAHRKELDASTESAEKWLDRMGMLIGPVGRLVEWGADEVFGWSDTIEANASQTAALNRELSASETILRKTAEVSEAVNVATAKATTGTQERARAAEDAAAALEKQAAAEAAAIQAMLDGQEQASAILRAATDARLSEMERIDIAEQDALGRLLATEQASQEQILALEAEFAQRRIDLQAQVAEASRARAAQAAADAAAIQMAYLDATSGLAGAAADAFGLVAEQLSATNRDAALAAFAISKAAAIGQVAVDTALAVSSVNAAWAAIPPVAAALSAAAIAVGATQAATIAAQQPAFHTGGPVGAGSPDEVSARLLRSEYVMNTQGRSVMGDAALSKANAGISPQPAVYAVSIYRHTRQIQRWKKDGLSAGDPIVQRIDAGRILGHRTDRG